MTDIVDADASWDGTGSLDDHRKREFTKIKHPGFGNLKPSKQAAGPPEDIAEKPTGTKKDAE